MNKKMVFTFVASFTMLAGVIAGFGFQENNSGLAHNGSAAPMLSVKKTPPLPTGIGAWESVNGGPWVKQTLVVQSGNMSNHLAPMEGGSYGEFGINAQSGSPLSDSYEYFSLSQYSGETDSSYGSNAWSIQLNTNFFNGNNGAQDWIQSVLQNNLYNWYSPWAHFSQFGIWEVDVSTQSYTSYLDSAPILSLSTGVTYEIQMDVSGGEIQTVLTITNYNTGNTQNWIVDAVDTYGLSGHWSSISGTVFGAGGGSEAQFTSPTTDFTVLQAISTSSWSPTFSTDQVTGETNNLNQGSTTTSWTAESGFYQFQSQTTSSN